MVHQLNVIQIIKMDTPAVLLMDGVEIHRVIVRVAIALITVKVKLKKNLSWICMINPITGQMIKPWEFELPTIICLLKL